MPSQYLRPVRNVFNGQQYSLDPSTRTAGASLYNWQWLSTYTTEAADAVNESTLNTAPSSIIYSEDHDTWLSIYPESFAAIEFTLPALSISPDYISIIAYAANGYSSDRPLFMSLYPSGSWNSPITYSGTVLSNSYGYVGNNFTLTDDEKLALVRSSGNLLLNVSTQGGYSTGAASLDIAQIYVYVSGDSVLGETLSAPLYTSGPTSATPKTATLFTTGPFPYLNNMPLYTYAWSPESGMPLFIEGYLTVETGVPLYTSGFTNASNSMELYVSSGIDKAVDLFLKVITPTEISGNVPLFAYSFLTQESGMSLYAECKAPSGDFPLFTAGYYGSGVAGQDLYVGGGVGGEFLISSDVNFYTSGNLEPRTSIPLFISGPSQVDAVSYATLFINNDTILNNALNLYLNNTNEPSYSGVKLFISGEGLYNGSSVSRGYAPLYISRGVESVDASIQFTIAGPSGINSSVDMYVAGANISSSGLYLTMSDVVGPVNDSTNMYIHGF